MKKIISGICAGVMLTMSMTGCTLLEKVENSVGNFLESPVKLTEENDAVVYSEFPQKLTAKKIATLDMNDKSMNIADGGIYYRAEGDKYGIMSFDGKHDTGAIYSYCSPTKNFFMVVKEIPETEELVIENLNNVGVIDATGKTIVPAEYASVDVLNDRFIKVCEVNEQVDSKEDALVFYTDRSFAMFANDDDTFFKGIWYVYDTKTGEKVEGVTGTQAYAMNAYGNNIEFTNDAGERKKVNAKGEELPAGTKLLSDGSYIVEGEGQATAYDTDGQKLFDYSTEDFTIFSCDEDSKYYLGRKYVDSQIKYVVIDKKGEIVSVEFDGSATLYGECVLVEGKLYNFAGEIVCEGDFKRVSVDDFTKNAILLTAENDDVTILKDGKTVLAQLAVDDSINVGSYDFTIGKKIDDRYHYYSFKDNDYTLKGSSYGPWVVETRNDDNTANLIDTISGETLVSGYEDFSSGVAEGSRFYAFGKNDDGTVDVYHIQ